MKFFSILIVLLILSGAGILFAIQGRRSNEAQAINAPVVRIFDEEGNEVSANQAPQRPARKSGGSDSGEQEWLTSFELIERSGETVRSDDLKGQPYVVGFFFTLCPSICINQNAKVQELQEKYRGQPVRLLSISCDPEVDRPEVLAEYAKRFDADPEQWLFLTGEMDNISRVAAEMYFLSASRRFHAEKFVLVDAQGKNVGFYNWDDPLQFKQLERDLDKLLAGQDVTGPPRSSAPEPDAEDATQAQ